MKVSIITALVLTTLLSVWVYGNEKPIAKKSPNWQPIYGFKYRGGKVYIDANSLGYNVGKEETFNYGDILIVAAEPTEIKKGNNEKFIAKSMVKHLMVECKSGVIIPVQDLYFGVEKPTFVDTPLGAQEYEINSENAISMNPKNPLLSALCPIWT